MVVLQTLIETAAIGGIAFFWLNLTVENDMAYHFF